jgi:hypothetical protein
MYRFAKANTAGFGTLTRHQINGRYHMNWVPQLPDGTVADSCPSPASCASAYAIGSAVRGMPPRSSGSSAAHWPDRARRPGLAQLAERRVRTPS